MVDYIPVIIAIIAGVPGLMAIYVQYRRDTNETASRSMLDDANASKIMSDTLKNVISDLRAEMESRDTSHKLEIVLLQEQLEAERVSRRDLEKRLDGMIVVVSQLQEQVRSLGGVPIDIPTDSHKSQE